MEGSVNTSLEMVLWLWFIQGMVDLPFLKVNMTKELKHGEVLANHFLGIKL